MRPGGLFRALNRDGVLVIRLVGEVDIADAADLEAALSAAASNDDTQPLIVDLTDLDYCDSAVIAALIRQRKRYGERFEIVLPKTAKMRRIFDILSLETALHISDDLRSAAGTRVLRNP